MRDLGAAHTIDYTDDVTAQVRAIAPESVDAVLHLAGDAAVLAGLLAAGGRLASTLGFGPDHHPAAVSIMADPTPATLERLAADVAAGRIRVPVTNTYPAGRRRPGARRLRHRRNRQGRRHRRRAARPREVAVKLAQAARVDRFCGQIDWGLNLPSALTTSPKEQHAT